MKKILIFLLMGLLLSGCASSTTTSVSDKNEVVLDFGTRQVTKEELYQSILYSSNGLTSVQNMVEEMIVEEEIPLTDEIKKDAKKRVEELKEMYGELFETIIQMNGFEDEASYLKEVEYAMQREALVKSYVLEFYDDYVEKYNPYKIRYISFAKEETAKEALAKIKEGSTFADIIKEYELKDAGEEEVVSKKANTKLPTALFTALDLRTENGLLDEVIAYEANNLYYIVDLVEKDPEKMKEDVSDFIIIQSGVADETIAHYLKKNGFKIYDENVYDAFVESHPEYFK